jgi:hypothetical protein
LYGVEASGTFAATISGASARTRSINSSKVSASTIRPGMSDSVVNTSASGSHTAVTVKTFGIRDLSL